MLSIFKEYEFSISISINIAVSLYLREESKDLNIDSAYVNLSDVISKTCIVSSL
jgi:hypothetical protein